VAVWRDGPVGAIMSIWHDPDDEEQPFYQSITLFERLDGVWTQVAPPGPLSMAKGRLIRVRFSLAPAPVRYAMDARTSGWRVG
jgi:hypothetical protein